ncbi:putative holin-like toxin [Paenibacillus sp. FSL R7-0333]|uniref:putative holin-like toxin n=1 Tax=Paenibacillus sp. FSL R7-0333 TaxID=1926587 RepID=UPI00404692F0
MFRRRFVRTNTNKSSSRIGGCSLCILLSNRIGLKGRSATSLRREGCLVTVFEAMMLMLTFGSLIVALLSNKRK